MAHRRSAAATASLHDFGESPAGHSGHRPRARPRGVTAFHVCDVSTRPATVAGTRPPMSGTARCSRRMPAPSSLSLAMMFVVVVAMRWLPRGDLPVAPSEIRARDGAFLGGADASGTTIRKKMVDGKGGGDADDAEAEASGGDPCDPEWGFDEGEPEDASARHGEDRGAPPHPPARGHQPPEAAGWVGAGWLLDGWRTGRRGGGAGGAMGAEPRLGRDGLPCVVSPPGRPAARPGERTSRKSAREIDVAAHRAATSADGATDESTAELSSKESEEAEEERKQLRFARKHSARREAKRLKGVYEIIRGVAVSAAEEEANEPAEGTTTATSPPRRPVSLRNAVRPKNTARPPGPAGCGPRGLGPACATGSDPGVCQVVGGRTTQVMNQAAVVRRGTVREAGADGAGHEGASLEATSSAKVAAPSLAEVAPGWLMASWVSNVPAHYAPVARLEGEEEGETEAAKSASDERRGEKDGGRGARRRLASTPSVRLVHAAQSEVHVAYHHGGRWSPTSAAVRWLELEEGTSVEAAVLCPLPPHRRAKATEVSGESAMGALKAAAEGAVKVKTAADPEEEVEMKATEAVERTRKEAEQEEARKRKEEQEWHPWRRRSFLAAGGSRSGTSAPKGEAGLGALALILRLDRPASFPTAAVKRSFDGGRSWGALEHRPPGVPLPVPGGSCASLFIDDEFTASDASGASETTSGTKAAAAMVFPTSAPGAMTCAARDARRRKGDKRGRGDMEGPPEPAAVCAERSGGMDRCRCWTEGDAFAAADVMGPDGRVIAPLPRVGQPEAASVPSSHPWLAAAAIFTGGRRDTGKLRAMLRPARDVRAGAAAPGALFGDIGLKTKTDVARPPPVVAAIAGIPWAHVSDLTVPTAAALAAEPAGGQGGEVETTGLGSWSPARKTRLATGGGGLAVVRLVDGRTLAVHHAVFGGDGRHVLAASVSKDGGDTWCAYGRWKTAREVPRHILPPPRQRTGADVAGGGAGGAIALATPELEAELEAEAAFAEDLAASMPLFDTRAVTLEEGAPLECRRLKDRQPRAGEAEVGHRVGERRAADADDRGCDPLSGVGAPVVVQETLPQSGAGNRSGVGDDGDHGGRGGVVHVVYVKDGTELVHVVINPEAIN